MNNDTKLILEELQKLRQEMAGLFEDMNHRMDKLEAKIDEKFDGFRNQFCEELNKAAGIISKQITDATDDVFCETLYQEYLTNPEQGDSVTLEEAAQRLGEKR